MRVSKINRPKAVAIPFTYWSAQVQRIFASVTLVPLTALASLCTGLGATLIFFYLRSIDQPITDSKALIGLAIGATFFAVGLILAIAFYLAVPVLVIQLYEKQNPKYEKPSLFSSQELVAVQIFSFSLATLYFVFTNFGDCPEYPIIFSAVLGLIVFFAAVYLTYRFYLLKNIQCRFLRLTILLFFGLLSFLPFSIIFILRGQFVGLPFEPEWAMFGLWLYVAFLNTGAGAIRRPKISFVMHVVLSLFILILLPLMSGNPALFPTAVARAVGIRTEALQTLGVPKGTCLQLQRAALDAGLQSPNEKCDHDSWNKVEGKVLSNLGTNWLLEMALLSNTNASKENTSFRVSIPAVGIQISQLVKKSANSIPASKTSCQTPGSKHS